MIVFTISCCSRVVLEPAGALGVAGLAKYVQEQGIQGQTLAAVTSGANMDFDKLGFIWSRCQEQTNPTDK